MYRVIQYWYCRDGNLELSRMMKEKPEESIFGYIDEKGNFVSSHFTDCSTYCIEEDFQEEWKVKKIK